MNTVDIHPKEKSFSFSDLKDSIGNVIQERVHRIEKTGTAWMKSISSGFLKTKEEIEAEFWNDERRVYLSLDQTRNNRDGYLNINLEGIDSGFMEENY